jgi:DNA-binding CsgD family transcriptional regulator
MPVARQPDLRAALRLVRHLEAADTATEVRRALLTDLPRSIRTRRDFSEDELALLELLRPHVAAALARVRRTERLQALRLTPRERAVLDLVAAGAPNVTIARELDMRPRTVEKHLEHAYAKLGVGSRTAAVAVLREITH